MIGAADRSGWLGLSAYDTTQPLPEGAVPLSAHVTAPAVLARRLAQIGLVPREAGAALQDRLQPGQRLVSAEGDLWRWDGYRTAAEDAPSAAALRLQQLNRLSQLRQDLDEAEIRAEDTLRAHEQLQQQLAELSRADQAAREARRAADARVTEANRALSRAEADRSIAGGKLESARLATARHEEEALAARQQLSEAERALAALPALDAARARVEDVKMTVEAARMTMMTRRSAHDEARREGEAGCAASRRSRRKSPAGVCVWKPPRSAAPSLPNARPRARRSFTRPPPRPKRSPPSAKSCQMPWPRRKTAASAPPIC